MQNVDPPRADYPGEAQRRGQPRRLEEIQGDQFHICWHIRPELIGQLEGANQAYPEMMAVKTPKQRQDMLFGPTSIDRVGEEQERDGVPDHCYATLSSMQRQTSAIVRTGWVGSRLLRKMASEWTSSG